MATVGPSTWRLHGDVRAGIVVAGVRLDVLADVDHDERVRRAREGPQPGTLEWRQLGALSLLPLGVAIPWLEIDLATRLLVDSLPPGAVRTSARDVTRTWRPALHLRAVCVSDTCAQRALNDVSMFAAVAPPVVLLRGSPDDPEAVALRAGELGIGVLVAGDGRHGTHGASIALTGPPSDRAVRDDARRWEVAETVYASLQLSPTGPG